MSSTRSLRVDRRHRELALCCMLYRSSVVQQHYMMPPSHAEARNLQSPPFLLPFRRSCSLTKEHGEVTEWLKVPLSKSGIPARVSRVRISPSPPRKNDDSGHRFFVRVELDPTYSALLRCERSVHMPRNDEIDRLLEPWSPANRPPADADGRRDWLNARIFDTQPSVDERPLLLRSSGSIRGVPHTRPASLLPGDDSADINRP